MSRINQTLCSTLRRAQAAARSGASIGALFASILAGAASAAAGQGVDFSKISPPDLVAKTPKGKLVNPYKDSQADIVSQGNSLFLSYGCSGCHGGSGGGGICPPLTDGVWIYGGDDDTLFRLVTLGSDALQKQGYSRMGLENVVAPMPPFGSTIKSADELWKILAFVRSRYDGDPSGKYGTAPAAR
jgi:mono/diheme cytochrome c family protein